MFIPETKSVISLVEGAARFAVPKGLGGFEVITDEVKVSVIGTVFEVQRWASVPRSEVLVLEGSVAVVRGDRIPLPLRVGERVEVTSQGLMFHAVRVEREGEKPFPRARLGVGEKSKSKATAAKKPSRTPDSDNPVEPRTEGNVPLDLPVNQRREVDPDGED